MIEKIRLKLKINRRTYISRPVVHKEVILPPGATSDCLEIFLDSTLWGRGEWGWSVEGRAEQ